GSAWSGLRHGRRPRSPRQNATTKPRKHEELTKKNSQRFLLRDVFESSCFRGCILTLLVIELPLKAWCQRCADVDVFGPAFFTYLSNQLIRSASTCSSVSRAASPCASS